VNGFELWCVEGRIMPRNAAWPYFGDRFLEGIKPDDPELFPTGAKFL